MLHRDAAHTFICRHFSNVIELLLLSAKRYLPELAVIQPHERKKGEHEAKEHTIYA